MAGRSDRWDRERFQYERERDRYGDERERFRFDDDDRERFQRRPSPPRFREDFGGRRPPFRDDEYVRDRRFYEEDEVRFMDRRRYSPPPRHMDREDFDRHVVIEKARRPTMVRRQSSLDTFDRFPRGFHEREEYGPPARREDYRPQPYMPIPLPRSRALPPPRRMYDNYDEIKVSDPDYYGDEEYRNYPERMREREVVRMRRHERSRDRSQARSRRSSSRSSSTTSSSSSSVTTTKTATTVKSEYPKKGKTRIPSRLVSKRAIIDLGYPFEEEGNTIIIQRALGQENIDDLLKLSEDYKKSELEVASARSEHGEVIEEVIKKEEVVVAPPPPPTPPPPPPPPAPAPVEEPVIIDAPPPAPPPPVEAPVPVINTTTTMVSVRDVSPSRMTTSSYSTCTSDSTCTTLTRAPVIVDAGPRELVRHRRHRSHSRGDLVRAERLSDGQLVIYEERVEKIEEPRRGVRIEKDKKGPPPKLVRAMLATLT